MAAMTDDACPPTSGVYDLDLTLKVNSVEERFEHYVSTPDDSIGANPAIRMWMKQHPDFPFKIMYRRRRSKSVRRFRH